MRCPICKNTLDASSPKPFCSERCKTIDLAHWLQGTYRIPSVEDDDSDMSNENTQRNGGQGER